MSSRRRSRAIALATLAAFASILTAAACGLDLQGQAGDNTTGDGSPTGDGSGGDGSTGGDGDPQGDGNGGDGGPGSDGSPDVVLPPADCGASPQVLEISAGGDHTCAVVSGGCVYCWGSNVDGELGVDSGKAPAGPSIVPFIYNATHVAAGGDFGAPPQFSCAGLDNGEVECWGSNQYGQFGTGDNDPPGASPPYKFNPGAGKVLEISLGRLHGCARFEQGTRCWGANNAAQLGRGNTMTPGGPAPLSGGPAITSIGGAGVDHTCATTTGDTLLCWGSNDQKQVDPTGPAGPNTTPLTRGDPLGVVQVSSGNKFSCAVLSDAGTSCWGYNTSAQLGRTAASPAAPGAVNFPTPQSTDQITAGLSHACAKTSDGGVWCWGQNGKGQAGQDGGASAQVPATVNLPPATLVTAGNAHSCALLADHTVQCWGDNSALQLGAADAGASSYTPVTVTFP